MFNMPKIWLDYAEFSAACQKVTDTRIIYDRALQTLPVTQHKLIWQYYIEWAVGLTNSLDENEEMENDEIENDFAETAIHAYKRYIKLVPTAREDFIEYLLEVDRIEEVLPILE